MNIKIFGPGCPGCGKLTERVHEALQQIGKESISVEKVSDIEKIAEEGIIDMPALMIDGEVKCAGEIPTVEQIKEWINE